MKPYYLFVCLMVGALGLWSCETVIDANLDEGPTQLSVDATLTDQPGRQTIRLTQTAPYFDNRIPPPVVGATVTVTDNAGQAFTFTDPDNDGYYVWEPVKKDTLGHVGRTYSLSITYQNETYRATSVMNRVPAIDSITFRKEKLNPLSQQEGYRAEFFARDLPGATDYYRIKYYYNGQLQNRSRDIITAQDGAFRGSADTDGLQFIVPIRQSINPDSLYALDDVVRVELYSLSLGSFDFWQQLAQEITNGGLFATPPANVPTNVLNTNVSGRRATGFFITSAVRSRTARVSPENIRASE